MRLLEKVERRLGEKLFLKGDRCFGPKCAMTRRGYPPGAHGRKRKSKRGASEFRKLFMEKQKVRYLYGLDDRVIKRYSTKAEAKRGVFSLNLLRILEGRLDNVLFRLGFAPSRRMAKHFVGYGHITVNGRIVDIPSYSVKKGDVIAIKEKSLKSPMFVNLDNQLKKVEVPHWLNLDKSNKSGTVLGLPDVENIEATIDVSRVKEFYSR